MAEEKREKLELLTPEQSLKMFIACTLMDQKAEGKGKKRSLKNAMIFEMWHMLFLCSGLAGGVAWWMQPHQKAGVGAQTGCASSVSAAIDPSSRFSLLLCLIVQHVAVGCLQDVQ